VHHLLLALFPGHLGTRLTRYNWPDMLVWKCGRHIMSSTLACPANYTWLASFPGGLGTRLIIDGAL